MAGPSTIYLVRHGECKANVAEMNLSPEVDLITDKGRAQASLLGKALQDQVFTRAFASTYSRAQDTANEILAQLKGPVPELEIDQRIRERELGDFENKPMGYLFDTMFAEVKEKGTKLVDFEVPNGEPVQQLEARIGSFLEELFKIIHESKEPQNILVVTHGVIMLRIMLRLRLWSKEPSRGLTLNNFKLHNTSIPAKNTAYHILTVNASTENDARKTVIDITKMHESGHLEPLKPKVPPPPNPAMDAIANKWMEIVGEQCATV